MIAGLKRAALLAVPFLLLTSACKSKDSSSPPPANDSPAKDTSSAWTSKFTKVEDSQSNLTKTSLITKFTESSAGNLFLTAPLNNGWVTLKSADQGSTWAISDSSGTGFMMHAASDSQGNVFTAGDGPAATGSAGIVRKHDGTSWSEAKKFQLESGLTTHFVGLGIDSSDALYVAGYGGVSTPYSLTKSFVLKSTDHGATWTVLGQFIPGTETARTSCLPSGLYVTSTNKVFTWGFCGMGGDEDYIQMSSNGGSTWSLVHESWGDGRVRAMAEWNNGILIAREYTSGPNSGHIKLFHTLDNFAHFKEVFDYPGQYIGGFRVDSRGYIYLSGIGSTGSFLAGVKDGIWTTLLDSSQSLQSPEDEFANDMFFTSDNHIIYSTVYVADSSAPVGNNGILRIYRADLTSTTPWTPTPLSNGTDKVSPVGAGKKLIYISNTLLDGHMGATDAQAIAAADAVCNSDPAKPSFAAGTFKALIVNSARVACTSANCAAGGTGEHTDWVLASNQEYVKRDGSTFASTNGVGLITSVSRVLGNHVPYPTWSGLLNEPSTDWTSEPIWQCNAYTSNNPGLWSTALDPGGSDLTSLYLAGNWTTCEKYLGLICVEQ